MPQPRTAPPQPHATTFVARPDGRCHVKICGLRDPDHAALAVAHGADAIGVVLHSASPRHVDDASAADVVRAATGALTVAVVVDASLERLRGIVDEVGVGAVQLHGTWEPAVRDGLRASHPHVAVIRAHRVAPEADVWPRFAGGGADAVIVDAAVPGAHGGTGRTLRWQHLDADVPAFLAGGLDAANVADAVTRTAAFGVDVSSGVESAPGRKDPARIIEFLAACAATRSAGSAT
jgi:phosphoribosylanthranilate isomerase